MAADTPTATPPPRRTRDDDLVRDVLRGMREDNAALRTSVERQGDRVGKSVDRQTLLIVLAFVILGGIAGVRSVVSATEDGLRIEGSAATSTTSPSITTNAGLDRPEPSP
jgi:hypothetical protein